MSYQVGGYCYATPADAAAAACAGFSPVSQLIGGTYLQTASCASSNETGGMLLTITNTPLDGSPATTATIEHRIDFPPCVQGQVVDAYLTILGAVLAAFAVIYGLWKLRQFLNVNPRNET